MTVIHLPVGWRGARRSAARRPSGADDRISWRSSSASSSPCSASRRRHRPCSSRSTSRRRRSTQPPAATGPSSGSSSCPELLATDLEAATISSTRRQQLRGVLAGIAERDDVSVLAIAAPDGTVLVSTDQTRDGTSLGASEPWSRAASGQVGSEISSPDDEAGAGSTRRRRDDARRVLPAHHAGRRCRRRRRRGAVRRPDPRPPRGHPARHPARHRRRGGVPRPAPRLDLPGGARSPDPPDGPAHRGREARRADRAVFTRDRHRHARRRVPGPHRERARRSRTTGRPGADDLDRHAADRARRPAPASP